MVCPETLVMPLGLYHDARERRMADFVRPGLFNGVSYVDGSWEAWKRLPRPQHDDDDDEQGWEEMRAKRDKKRSIWKSKKNFFGDLAL